VSESGSGSLAPLVDDHARRLAVGNLAELSPTLRATFSPDLATTFTPLPAPLPGDWQADHPEPGQTYEAYRVARPNRPDTRRRTLYILPFAERGAAPATPDLGLMAAFARAHFTLPVRVLPPISPATTGARLRKSGDRLQALATDLLDHLKTALPPDGYALIGITSIDLYPGDDWNFVFGMASFRERVGVYSTARYQPSFYGHEDLYPPPEAWILRRSLKVMAHEIGHMFGMEHCIYFQCVMNGSNHLEQSDRQPMHLCPVCLRKLHRAVGYDPVDRYRTLSRFFRHARLGPEADWTRARAEAIAAEAAAAKK
jgi:archaemetzincin